MWGCGGVGVWGFKGWKSAFLERRMETLQPIDSSFDPGNTDTLYPDSRP